MSGELNTNTKIKRANIFQRAVLFLVKSYMRFVPSYKRGSCRFRPTCSEYAYQAILHFGVLRGGFLSLKRLLKCNPFYGKYVTYDPLPDFKDIKNKEK